jgi:hypothetical protein
VCLATAAGICLALALVACRGHTQPQATPEPADEATATASPPAPGAVTTTPAPSVSASRRATSTEAPAQASSTPSQGRGPIAFSSGPNLLPSDLVARGTGAPGRGPFTGERLIIPNLGIDTPISVAVVGSDGKMPSPHSINEVVWYDFSMWPTLGGTPGIGGNVVLAGDALRPGVGSGVFTSVGRSHIGDYVKMSLTDGEVLCYRVELNKIADATQVDFGDVVSATPEESATLITGAGEATRVVVWGRRADCADEPAPRPTPAPPATPTGHYKLKIVAENYRFTVVEGGTVPKGVHTVDFTLELRDAGVKHSITFYDTAGRELIATEPVEGPTTAAGAFGVGPPQSPGRYTFRCSVHPAMTGFITVES